MEGVIDGIGGATDVCAASFITGLITDVLDDYQFSQEMVQDVDSPEEEEDRDVCEAQLVFDAGEPTIAECDEEAVEMLAAASFVNEEAVRHATPFASSGFEDGTESMVANYGCLDDDDNEEVCMFMDDDDVDDDYEMEAASYIHMALRFAKVALAAGLEHVEAAVEAANELALPAENVLVIEPAKSSALSFALLQHADDTCSVHSADSEDEHGTEALPQVLDAPGMKMITSGPSAEQEAEALRMRAHRVFRQASSDGGLFSALKQVRSMQGKSAVLLQPCGFPRCLGPTREANKVRAELSKLVEPVVPTGQVQLAEPAQTEEPIKHKEANVSKSPKNSDPRTKAQPSTSIPKSSQVIAPAAADSSSSSPAASKKTHEAVSNVEPVQPTIRSLHTSRSRRNVIGGVVRRQILPCEDLCEKQKTPATPSRHSSTVLRRHRSKHTDAPAAFRMDSPAGTKHDDDTRESSLTRAYEALGAEMHSLDDGSEVDFHGCGSRNCGRVPFTAPQCNSHSSRRTTAFGLGHAPFAAAPAPYVGRRAPVSAMAFDLGDDATSMVSFTTSQKPMPSSPSRLSSVGAVRVAKSRRSLGHLPPLPTSTSTGPLPSLTAKPGHSKQRSQDPLAWSMGDLTSSKGKWGSMSMGSVF